MSANKSPSDPRSTLACGNTQCGLPFGGPVRFCPFCGTEQARTAAPKIEMPEKSRNDPWVVPTEPPSHVPESETDQTALPNTKPGSPVVDGAQSASSRNPRGPRRWRGLAIAALLVAAAGWLLRERLVPPTGQLVVSALPSLDAMVTVDGTDTGKPGQQLTIPVGDHLVGLRAAHWSAEPSRVIIVVGRLSRVTFSPKPDLATLQVQAQPPGATVSINGRKIAEQPAMLPLAPGTWRLLAEAPGFQPATQSVVLTPGEQRTVMLQLDPVPDTRTRIMAQVGAWSAPLQLASGDNFSFVFHGQVRMRLGGRVVLLDGADADLGTINAHSLQLKSATDHPVPVEVLIHHVGVP